MPKRGSFWSNRGTRAAPEVEEEEVGPEWRGAGNLPEGGALEARLTAARAEVRGAREKEEGIAMLRAVGGAKEQGAETAGREAGAKAEVGPPARGKVRDNTYIIMQVSKNEI